MPHARSPWNLGAASLGAPAAARLLDATLACIARVGVAKTTVDDVARQAGVSRATLYRLFPGKQPLLEAVVARELDRFGAVLDRAAAGATSLDDLLVAVIAQGATHLERHEALATVRAHEPDLLLPYLCFERAGLALSRAGELLAPLLAPYVGRDRAPRAGEWVARAVLAYLCAPCDAVRLTDPESVRDLVVTFIAPSLAGTAAATPTKG